MKRFGLATILTLALAASSAPAFALEQGEASAARTVPISLSGFDPSSTIDSERLLGRLENAAARACATPEVSNPGPTLRRAIQNCEKNALETAVERINAPELTRLHRQRLDE